MTLLMLLCSQEWTALTVRPVVKFMSEADRERGARIVWIEQCVAKKEIWQ
jgi:hypothetical protein